MASITAQVIDSHTSQPVGGMAVMLRCFGQTEANKLTFRAHTSANGHVTSWSLVGEDEELLLGQNEFRSCVTIGDGHEESMVTGQVHGQGVKERRTFSANEKLILEQHYINGSYPKPEVYDELARRLSFCGLILQIGSEDEVLGVQLPETQRVESTDTTLTPHQPVDVILGHNLESPTASPLEAHTPRPKRDVLGKPKPGRISKRAFRNKNLFSFRKTSQGDLSTAMLRKRRKIDAGVGRSKISPYDRACQQHLKDFGLYTENKGREPKNIIEIRNEMEQARESPSPTQKEFEMIQDAANKRVGEAKTVSVVVLQMLSQAKIQWEQSLSFNNLAPMDDGTLVTPVPELYQGAEPGNLHAEIRKKDINQYIVPSKHSHAPILPNFSIEAKGPDGSPAVAKRQAAINAHNGARAMNFIRKFGTVSDTDDETARSFAVTFVDGTVKYYASHQVKTASGQVEYLLTPLGARVSTNSLSDRKKSKDELNNLAGLAHKMRVEAIELANARHEREKVNLASQEDQVDADPPSQLGARQLKQLQRQGDTKPRRSLRMKKPIQVSGS
ncbi:hypothetical protein V8E51_012134 [Hyaloscypha variabilis]